MITCLLYYVNFSRGVWHVQYTNRGVWNVQYTNKGVWHVQYTNRGASSGRPVLVVEYIYIYQIFQEFFLRLSTR